MYIELYLTYLYFYKIYFFNIQNISIVRCEDEKSSEGDNSEDEKKNKDDSEGYEDFTVVIRKIFTGKNSEGEGEMGAIQYICISALVILTIILIIGLIKIFT